MTYRQTKRAEAARRAKHGVATRRRNIAAGPAPDYPADLPNLRRTVIVIDRDHGLRVTQNAAAGPRQFLPGVGD